MSIPVNNYPYTDLHEMNMDWVLKQLQSLITAWAETKGEWDETKLEWAQTQEAYTDLYNYVHDYFDNLDIQQEVDNKINEMAYDGTLQPMINAAVAAYYDSVPTKNSTNPVQSGGVYDSLVQNFSPIMHNGIYRGKNHGTISGQAAFSAWLDDIGVTDGSFKDVYIGDSVTIQDGTYNLKWIVAGIDHYLRKGNNDVTKHHLTLIPETSLGYIVMNPSATTTGGYMGSNMFSIMASLETTLAGVVGTCFVSIEQPMSNATSGGKSSGIGSATVAAWIPCECEITGNDVIGNSYDIGIGEEQLPLFRFITPVSLLPDNFWIRDVSSAQSFGAYLATGQISGAVANNNAIACKPLINIGK